MEGHCSTVQNPQWAVVPMEEEEVGIIVKGKLFVYASKICVLRS